MRTGAAAGHHGYFHEALVFGSDAELVDTTVPFLLAGIAAGESAVVAVSKPYMRLLRAALPAGSGVEFLPGDDLYSNPASTIRAYRRLLARRAAEGAEQIRVIGDVPVDRAWDAWSRYESAINHAYDDFPLWSMCLYDSRVAPAPVLADVARTHPRQAGPGDRHEPSPAYTEPRAYLAENRPLEPDPLQAGPPLLELTDPTPGEARQAVRAATAGLPDVTRDDLLVAVSEVVTNAFRYGRAPVHLRLWAAGPRVVVTVSDAGEGPRDPFAGLLPGSDGGPGGRGLWITHQSCDHVAAARDEHGWTIRLTAHPFA